MFLRTEWGRGSSLIVFGRCHLLARWANRGGEQLILKVLCVARADVCDEWADEPLWSTFFILHHSSLEYFTGTSKPAWKNEGPHHQAEIKGSNQEKCILCWKLRKTPGRCVLLWGAPSGCFRGLMFSWLALRHRRKWPCSLRSGMSAFLIYQNVLFRRAGTVPGFLQPCCRTLLNDMKKEILDSIWAIGLYGKWLKRCIKSCSRARQS